MRNDSTNLSFDMTQMCTQMHTHTRCMQTHTIHNNNKIRLENKIMIMKYKVGSCLETLSKKTNKQKKK